MNPDSAADWLNRRASLAAVGGVAADGLTVATGCLGRGGETPTVSILAIGNLQRTFTIKFSTPDGTRIKVETHGSAHVARVADDDQHDSDITVLADPTLSDALLPVPWYTTFVNDALAITHNLQTEGGTWVTGAASWPDTPLGDTVSLGQTGLDLDPLGYRTRLVLAFAAGRYDRPTLTADLLRRDQICPETQLLAQFDADGIDAAFVYWNMTVERDYPYLELPVTINLSDPDRASAYTTVSYTLPGGVTTCNGPIQYVATHRVNATATKSMFEALVETAGSSLESSGFTVCAGHPYYFGDVPPAT